MPRLGKELNLFPDCLLIDSRLDSAAVWWALYTKGRHEKHVMRKLQAMNIPFYCPLIPRRFRSHGRIRTALIPLFPSYVFMLADEQQRSQSLTTNAICQCHTVLDGDRLRHELLQVERLIQTGAALTPESRLEAGRQVRVRQGPFQGIEGLVIKRQSGSRLLVALHFMGQGVSVRVEDFELDPLDSPPMLNV